MTGAAQDGRFGALSEPPFRRLFAAQAVSLFGDRVVPVALAFAILDAGGSATDLGLVLAAQIVPLVFGLLVGGVVADRTSRRVVMVAADLVRLGSQGALGILFIAGAAPLAALAALQAVSGAASGFFGPASIGVLPAVVSPARLQDANALRGLADSAAGIGGPALGGVLVVTVGAGEALLIDALTFALSAALLVGLRARPDAAVAVDAPSTRPLRDLVDGWRAFTARTWVWAIVAAFAVANTLHSFRLVLGPEVARQHLGGAGAWASILALGGVGGVLGGLVVLRLRVQRLLVVAVCGVVFATLPTLALAAPAPLWVNLAAMLAGGAGSVVFGALWETALQQHVPAAQLSRVSSYDWIGSLAFTPIGFALAGPVAAAVGTSATLWGAGSLDLLCLAALLLVPSVRAVRALPRPAA